MIRIGSCAAAALLVGLVLLAPEPASAWNPFARSSDTPPAKSTASAPTTAKAAKAAKAQQADAAAREAGKLNQAAHAASKADHAAVKRTQTVSDRPAWSPVTSRYRWGAAQQPSPARRAVTSTVNTLTLKPLRDKLSGRSNSHNPWTRSPPVTNTSANKRPGLLGSLFKPKPKPKTGPQTVSEWIAQDRPGF